MNVIKTSSINEMRTHLISRSVDFTLHKPLLSVEVATFLLYNLTGQIVGYQRYNPSFPSAFPGDGKQTNLRDRRYYNYVTSGQIGLFGLESFNERTNVVFVTEGIFDCCRLTKRRATAFAMLTNNPSSSMRNFLMCLGVPVVAVCDNDKSGLKLRTAGHYHEIVSDGKDLGECSEHFVDYLLNKYKV
jgi:hypothetical protein